VKEGILLLKRRDSWAIFYVYIDKSSKKSTLSGGGGGKHWNFNTIYRGLGILGIKLFKMYMY